MRISKAIFAPHVSLRLNSTFELTARFLLLQKTRQPAGIAIRGYKSITENSGIIRQSK